MAQDDSAPTPALLATLGPYRLGTRLGSGGVGLVHSAEDTRTGERCAVKFARHEGQVLQGSIRWEAEVLEHFDHPGVVRLRAAGPPCGTAWFAMERLDGESLRTLMSDSWRRPRGTESGMFPIRERLRERHPVSDPFMPDALAVMQAVCRSLSHIHERGFVHADVKPENIVVCDRGRVVLVDLGAAQSFGLGQPAEREDSTAFGTWSYMAPECRNGSAFTPAADVYALGAILHEFLLGYTPAERCVTRHVTSLRTASPHSSPLLALAGVATSHEPGMRPDLLAFSRELVRFGAEVP